MGRVANKVAFITGGARGQGRSHAIRLAEEGADIVLVDACAQLGVTGKYVQYPSLDDLYETAAMVEKFDRRVLARRADVRNSSALAASVNDALEEFGGIDIVCANAGTFSVGKSWELDDAEWQEIIDVDLTGVWKTLKAVIPSMIDRDRGGSIIMTASVAGLRGMENVSHYVAAKHGVMGLTKALANELGHHRIRVNNVVPGTTDTPLANNSLCASVFRPDLENPTGDDIGEVMQMLNALPVDWIEPVDISNAVLWLASDESRFVTGTSVIVDAGFSNNK